MLLCKMVIKCMGTILKKKALIFPQFMRIYTPYGGYDEAVPLSSGSYHLFEKFPHI